MRVIVETGNPVTLLGAGSCSARDLRRALTMAPHLVAADGGADRALALGHVPDAVVGDLDSLSAAARARLDAGRLHRIGDQDSTDFDKCLSVIRAPWILALGFTGARLDHTLAGFSTLARFPDRRCIMLGGGDLCFAAPPRLALDLTVGARLSLFPMAPVRGGSEGLRWPIAGLAFSPAGVIGTSNEVSASRVALEFDAPGMLVMLAARHLKPVLGGLQAAPRWTEGAGC